MLYIRENIKSVSLNCKITSKLQGTKLVFSKIYKNQIILSIFERGHKLIGSRINNSIIKS